MTTKTTTTPTIKIKYDNTYIWPWRVSFNNTAENEKGFATYEEAREFTEGWELVDGRFWHRETCFCTSVTDFKFLLKSRTDVEHLLNAIVWRSSLEGYDYWYNIRNKGHTKESLEKLEFYIREHPEYNGELEVEENKVEPLFSVPYGHCAILASGVTYVGLIKQGGSSASWEVRIERGETVSYITDLSRDQAFYVLTVVNEARENAIKEYGEAK